VWDIRSMKFVPKPMQEAYAHVMAMGAVEGPTSAMFDDIPRNLGPARALGMTTIWLKSDAPWGKHGPLMDVAPGDIDHQTDDLSQFLHSIRI
jgi:putative hydrolase of the HAD superfamily